MIKILHVVGKMDYGGMETLIMNLYRNIDRSKIQFDFMVHYTERGKYDDEIDRLDGKIFIMPKTVPGNFFLLKKRYKAFFKEHNKYKYVHIHLHNIAFLIFPQAKRYGIKCLLHLHNSGIERNVKGYMGYFTTRLAVSKADQIFACSQESARYFIKNGEAYEIIKNGICADKFYYNEEIRNCVRTELGLTDKFVMLCVSRFAIQKNHEFLIDIVSEMKKMSSNNCILLVGTGPLEDKIRNKVKQLSLENEVKFLGSRGDVNELMQAADAFVMPSLWEGLALSYIEAQAAGLRVYTSREALSREACITNLIKGIPLSVNAKKWAEIIYHHRRYERKSQKELIEKSGFDIRETARYIEKFYEDGL